MCHENTDDDVREIRRLAQNRNLTYREIGEMFGIKEQHTRDIAIGRKRRWVI